MVITGRWNGKPVTISIKPNCLTISIDDPANADVFSYDFEGRLWTAYLDGISYRRGLDGKMIAKWRAAGEDRERRRLTQPEALKIEDRARIQSLELYQATQQQDAKMSYALTPEAENAFQRVIAFDQERSIEDAMQYQQVYKPVGILPPDQYMAVVLQITEGCSFNTCTFCTFYKDRPFRARTPEEFRHHAEAVRDFLGAGLSLRRTIFLGDANALVLPMHRLMPLIEEIHQVYDVEKMGGLFAFLDGFSGEKKSVQDYALLRDRGLKRVYIGLESGHADLLHFLKKPGEPGDAVDAVQHLKAAGVAVGVIVLLGAGGQRYAEAHVRDTVDVLNAMQLDMDDILYFSNIIVRDEMPYAADAVAAGLLPLSQEECIAQGEVIRSQLKFDPQNGTPHISRYDIREFIY